MREDPADRSAELEIERAWRRADEADLACGELADRVRELEDALARECEDGERAAASSADRERVRRAAEQRAHAEEALRRDLARQLASGEREAGRARQALGDLAAAEERIRELELRLADARRAGDEAEQVAAAAAAARDRAERALDRRLGPESGPPPGSDDAHAETGRLRLEDLLRSRWEAAGARVPAEPSPATGFGPASPVRREPVPLPPGLPQPSVVAALRRELDGRAGAEAGLRARVVAAETRLATRVLLEQRTTATLRELRAELDGLRETLTRERDRRASAEAETARLRGELGGQRERSRDAYAAIGQLRDVLAPLEAARGPAGGGETPGGAIVPDRLSDALTRLRETTEPREPGASAPPPEGAAPAAPPPEGAAPAAPSHGQVAANGPPPGATSVSPAGGVGRPTLEPAFRRLARRDPDLAGRLLLDLLPCQRAAYPHPVAYDLVLGPGLGCVQVTVGTEAPRVELQGAARTREQVDFQIVGDPRRLARLLTAGPLRRMLRVGVARVRGRHPFGSGTRERVAAVRGLLALPLDLTGLRAAGMRLEPETLLALVAAMIDPAWTRGERFTLAHVDGGGRPVYLQIRDGAPPAVARTAPEGRVATETGGTATALAVRLSGSPAARGPALTVRGDSGALALLAEWVTRAQGG